MKVFTTGQVARICDVAPRTVSKWFDSGRLRGYRIPGSLDRRIPRQFLVPFLREYGMLREELYPRFCEKVLLLTTDLSLIQRTHACARGDEELFLDTAAGMFGLGLALSTCSFDAVVIDFDNESTTPLYLYHEACHYQPSLLKAIVFRLQEKGTRLQGHDNYSLAISETFDKPFDSRLLLTRLGTVIRQKKGID